MASTEPEKSIPSTELSPPTTNLYSDEIIDAVGRMSLEDLRKKDGGLKLLIAQYKEKSIDNRKLQNKISGLIVQKSELSSKLAVARERLDQIGGVGVILNILNIIAGAMLTVLSSFPDSTTKRILNFLAIGIFILCVFYYWSNRNHKKGLEEKENPE